jgi:release factor glutamine methyltransferase
MHGPPWTVKALLAATTEFFQNKQLDTPRLDAQVLLAHVLSCPKIELIVRYNDEPTPPQRDQFRELVRKRAEHWPTAYLTGHREFYLLNLEVSPAVLIPRPDTETLVLAALEQPVGACA